MSGVGLVAISWPLNHDPTPGLRGSQIGVNPRKHRMRWYRVSQPNKNPSARPVGPPPPAPRPGSSSVICPVRNLMRITYYLPTTKDVPPERIFDHIPGTARWGTPALSRIRSSRRSHGASNTPEVARNTRKLDEKRTTRKHGQHEPWAGEIAAALSRVLLWISSVSPSNRPSLPATPLPCCPPPILRTKEVQVEKSATLLPAVRC